ncbi:hypothetical protein METHB2_180041 [Candidatus Methylobacter favarea]|uniref:Uncharacterized protein n=1 Tax=Candidatus Methylobacter favarea TaxID=2707345 RepID=A0A8S0Y5Z0_9GAMM|nr:hypothetical protein METHB2_180041 [Candidatus Methylobacter favarea]
MQIPRCKPLQLKHRIVGLSTSQPTNKIKLILFSDAAQGAEEKPGMIILG